jgi:GT2 family glycosyltransferase
VFTASPVVKRVAIVIPSLRRPDLVERCLAFISEQTLAPEQYETVIVENSSDDSAAPPRLPQNARRICLERNLGTTGSVNIGVRATSSEYVLILNNDVELPADFLATMIAFLDDTPAAGFATCKLLSAHQRSVLDGAGDALLVGGGAFRLGHYDLDRGQFDGVQPIFSGCGAAFMIRRGVFEQAGGLDEDLFAYLDDVDLSLRVQLLGHRGFCHGGVVGYHIGSATLGDVVHPRIVEWTTRNQILILVKDYPRSVALRVLHRIIAFQALWLLRAVRVGMIGPYLRGMASAMRLAPGTWRKRREVMRTRQLSDSEFLARLRASEAQVAEWHFSRPEANRSTLLNVYFALFGRR